jgi:hypothetical protein
MSASPLNADDQPRLRLYQPTHEEPRRQRPRRTLEQVFLKYVKPEMERKQRKRGTIRDIERALERWRAYWESRPPARTRRGARILDPCVVCDVKLRHLEEWRNAILSQFGPHTTNRYLGSIRQILVSATRRGVIRKRPTLEKLPEPAAKRYYLTPAQVERLWKAADAATWPRSAGMSAGDWWRCALILYWTYGFRTQELIAFQVGKAGLTFASLSLCSETPNPEGTAISAHGWLTYIPQKQQWAKPQPLYLPLTPTARAAVDRLVAAATIRDGSPQPTAAIFPWGCAHKSLYREWRSLQRRADVAAKSGQPYLLKSLRKSAATYLEKHHKGLGAAVCGWADRESSQVMAKHYAVDELTLVEKLADYPVPECFRTIAESPQLKLF